MNANNCNWELFKQRVFSSSALLSPPPPFEIARVIFTWENQWKRRHQAEKVVFERHQLAGMKRSQLTCLGTSIVLSRTFWKDKTGKLAGLQFESFLFALIHDSLKSRLKVHHVELKFGINKPTHQILRQMRKSPLFDEQLSC